MPKLAKFGIGAAVLIVLVVLLLPFTVVDAGEKAVVIRNGAVSRVLDPGLHGILPIIEGVVTFDTRTQKEQTNAEAASADLQTVNTTVAVNYNVNPSKVADMYTRLGANYQSTIIDPAIQEVVKATTANYTAEELITKRADVTTKIQSALAERLAPNDIVVTSVSIVNFAFSGSFNAAIEAKVTAEQNALAAKNKLDQVQYEAQQRIAQAEGEAKAIQIQAQAINSQGGADYVQLQAIKQWDGKLPAQMIPGSTVPFISLSAK